MNGLRSTSCKFTESRFYFAAGGGEAGDIAPIKPLCTVRSYIFFNAIRKNFWFLVVQPHTPLHKFIPHKKTCLWSQREYNLFKILQKGVYIYRYVTRTQTGLKNISEGYIYIYCTLSHYILQTVELIQFDLIV